MKEFVFKINKLFPGSVPPTPTPHPSVDVDQDLDRESQEYLEALAQATAELDYCVNLCKSHVMMETCFDISMSTGNVATAMQDSHRGT